MRKIVLTILVGIALPVFVSAQTQSDQQTTTTTPPPQPKPKANTIEELRLKLTADGSLYLMWTFSNQFWVSYNQSNPGTTVLGERAN